MSWLSILQDGIHLGRFVVRWGQGGEVVKKENCRTFDMALQITFFVPIVVMAGALDANGSPSNSFG